MTTPVRILSLLVLIAGIAGGHIPALAAGWLLIGLIGVRLALSSIGLQWRNFVIMLRRIRWLLLAIFVLYLGFTPGEAVLPSIGSWSPSYAGVREGLLRVAVLIAVIAAVHLLLVTTSRGELLAGLLWYGRPARRMGLDDHRFSVRLVLALEAVPRVQDLARKALREASATSHMARLAQTGSRVMQAVLREADREAGTITVPDPLPVPLWQWLIPLSVALLFAAMWQL